MDAIQIINDKVQGARVVGCSINAIFAGRQYRLIGAQFNDDFQEGLELLFERVEYDPITLQTARREIAISPTDAPLRRLLSQLVGFNYIRGVAYHIDF